MAGKRRLNRKTHKIINRLLIGSSVILALAGIAVLVLDYHVRVTTKDQIMTGDELAGIEFDVALVLGCGIYNNITPSPLLKERLDRAIELYEGGVVDRLLMSGDHGQPEYNEVSVMKQYAIERGVPSEAVFMDHAGFSTYESVYRADEIFGADKLLVVTQRYHLYRALYIADAIGMEAFGVSADRTRLSGQTIRDLREILARNKDVFYTLLKPEPTWLGEKISLASSGDITND